jgi:hypothetical protein
MFHKSIYIDFSHQNPPIGGGDHKSFYNDLFGSCLFHRAFATVNFFVYILSPKGIINPFTMIYLAPALFHKGLRYREFFCHAHNTI